ncbi:hypothetical protein HYV50_05360 [Candidatus Pacearchaeota archaeon]|nr:hypothetical protein [Candidatus Pacearchaeota archaeon]
MKTKFSRKEAEEKINGFFKKENFSADEVKKIKRIAMEFNIKLGNHRKLFCKKCLNKLKGKIRINKNYKTTMCENCGFLNRHKIGY